MFNEETKRKLRLMRLDGFIEADEQLKTEPGLENLSFDERFQVLIDRLYQQYFNEKVNKLIKTAKLRFPRADIHDIYYDNGRNIKKSTLEEFATCEYIEENRSIVLQGYTSTGKTYIACALAKEACRHLYKTKYIRLPDLLMEYNEKSIEPYGKDKMLRKYTNYRVLVIDEWLSTDMSKSDVEFLFELSERRFDCTSTIFCTLYNINEDWTKRLGRGTQAESIVERFRHNSFVIEMGDKNMREIFENPRKKRK